MQADCSGGSETVLPAETPQYGRRQSPPLMKAFPIFPFFLHMLGTNVGPCPNFLHCPLPPAPSSKMCAKFFAPILFPAQTLKFDVKKNQKQECRLKAPLQTCRVQMQHDRLAASFRWISPLMKRAAHRSSHSHTFQVPDRLLLCVVHKTTSCSIG